MIKTITTASGLKLRFLRKAARGPRLKTGDVVGVFYRGSFLDGNVFDANFSFNDFQPIPERNLFGFTLGAKRVIEGWEEGLAKCRLGDVVEITVPAALGYGSGGTESIPPNSTLVFTVVVVGMISAEMMALPENERKPLYYDLNTLTSNLRSLGLKFPLPVSAPSLANNPAFQVGTDLADTIRGQDVANLQVGLKGSDRFIGAGGGDLQAGGQGGDSFVIEALGDSTAGPGNRDRISDFQGRKGDRIDLTSLDADSILDGLQRFTFIGAAPFSGQAAELRYSAGLLQGDVNGDRQPELEMELWGNPKLQATYLLL